jgi:salicylate hydroxylase
MKVLNKAGAIDPVLEGTLPWKVWNDWSDKGEFLGGPGSASAGEFTDRYGWPSLGLSRTKLQLALKEAVEKASIPFLQGWKLKDLRTGSDSVIAVSDAGNEIEGAFLLGCDGLKSVTRDLIFARYGMEDRDPSFTGVGLVGQQQYCLRNKFADTKL